MASACDHHHHDGPPTTAAVEAGLSAAAERCDREGERLTTPRRRVLELLLQAGEPVKAYDLIGRFGLDGQAAKPPTVYRALDFLERQGLVHRIASISAYVACSSGEAAHAAAFLICDCCGAAEEVAPPAPEALTRAAEQAGYAIERTTIEAHGRCLACRATA